MAEGELSTRMTTRPSNRAEEAVSGPLRIAGFRERVAPFAGNQRFGQAFLAHSQPLHFNVADPLFYPLDQLQICPVLHIADDNIRMGAFSHGKNGHGQLGIPDAAADQSGIEHYRLYKAIAASPQNLILFRLLYAAGGVRADINQRRKRKTLG